MPLRRFTLDEYHRLIEIGFFDEDERVELLEGILVSMSPNYPPHIRTVIRLQRVFAAFFAREDVEVRMQGPVSIPELMTEPEPDLVISRESGADLDERRMPAEPDDSTALTWRSRTIDEGKIVTISQVSQDIQQAEFARHPYPADILVLMEVSDSSLSYDRTRKRAIYAQAGITEYWIWNLVDSSLEVYRDPHTSSAPSAPSTAFETAAQSRTAIHEAILTTGDALYQSIEDTLLLRRFTLEEYHHEIDLPPRGFGCAAGFP
jgi:Uma2 family endonuclease